MLISLCFDSSLFFSLTVSLSPSPSGRVLDSESTCSGEYTHVLSSGGCLYTPRTAGGAKGKEIRCRWHTGRQKQPKGTGRREDKTRKWRLEMHKRGRAAETLQKVWALSDHLGGCVCSLKVWLEWVYRLESIITGSRYGLCTCECIVQQAWVQHQSYWETPNTWLTKWTVQKSTEKNCDESNCRSYFHSCTGHFVPAPSKQIERGGWLHQPKGD